MKKIEITVTQVGNETGVNVKSEEIRDLPEVIMLLGIAIQACQQKLINNSNIIIPPPGKGFSGN